MNKNTLTFFLLFSFGLFSFQASAQNFWTSFEGTQAPAKGTVGILPKKFLIEQLDQASMQPFLDKLGNQQEKAQLISLPAPDGSMMNFHIWATPIMGPELQARFPHIRTFTAVADHNPRITAKIDYTLKGFHAMIYDGDKTFLIDPYSNVPDGFYISYYKKDCTMPFKDRMVCEVGAEREISPEGSIKENLSGGLPKLQLKQSGGTRRTYRLALSCTGEYAEAVDGSNPTLTGVFSAMTTTMNRVNGIYERELAVTMVFINTEDQVIYLNPATDPFTANNNGNMLLGQNQNNLDNTIGNNAYDIGHIFCTNGGGVAQLGSVCNHFVKGMGVTGLPAPVGDAFDVDYVAHEMGHQFGADHSFNDCNGNEWAPTAFEPGSGSTIMAYAGICGQYNNIQHHSDAYFHAGSLGEISDFLVENNSWGGGASCGTTASNDVHIPALPSITQHYTIPYQTPFELTAPMATGVQNGDSVTYNWEEWDLGDLQKDDTGAAWFTAGPCLRSYSPSTNRTRVFPLIDSLVKNNTEFPGGHLPEVARSMNFKLTARNIANGWGAFEMADSTLTIDVINTGAPFRVIYPDLSTVTWQANTQDTVTWDKAQTDLAPIQCNLVNIYLSLDGGFTYPDTLAENVPNTGFALIDVPNINTHKARIKVKGAGNIFFDLSDQDFSITGAVGIKETYLKEAVTIFPNPATSELNIKSASSDKIKLLLYNAIGQKIWSGNLEKEQMIHTEAFPRGLYLLHLENERTGAAITRKIILK